MIDLKKQLEKIEEEGVEAEKAMLLDNFNCADALTYYRNELAREAEKAVGRELNQHEMEKLEYYLDSESNLQVVHADAYGWVGEGWLSLGTTHEFYAYFDDSELKITPWRMAVLEKSEGVIFGDMSEEYSSILVYSPLSIEIDVSEDTIIECLLENMDHDGYYLDKEIL